MKKIFFVLVGLILTVTSAFAVGGGESTAPGNKTNEPKFTPVTLKDSEVIENIKASHLRKQSYNTDFDKKTVYAGKMNAVIGKTGGGVVSYDYYKGISGKDYTDPRFYTYNDFTPGTSDMKWSTHTWETNDDSLIVDRITTGFYGFKLNNDLDGWAIVPEMASELPVDVTSQYVGRYGIKEGEKAKAWRISLNPSACFENGVPIDADTYIYSYKELLDPIMKNRRADSIYAGEFAIYNAKNYFYAGQVVNTENATGANYKMSDLHKGSNGQYYTPNNEPVFLAVDFPLTSWLSGSTLKSYVENYGSTYFDLTNWDALVSMMNSDGLIPLTDSNFSLYATVTTGNPAWGETEDDLPAYFAYVSTYPELSWDEVGIIKTGKYEIVLITINETADPNYYVPYNLSSSYLVYEPIWEACKTYYNSKGDVVSKNSKDIARITTNAYTNAENTISYGPYRLSYFELDKQYTLDRNPNWYGYFDGNHLGQFQADRISYQVIEKHETALLSFQSGAIDAVNLQADDMERYGTSDYILYKPQSYTTKLTFNTDENSLRSRGTTVLTNGNFRKGFALAIDANTFASSLTTGTAGYGMLNTMYVYDPFTGTSYRSTDGAKKALVELYGLTYGEGGDFEDIDEAYDAVTGYDINAARDSMRKAYNELKAAGLYNDQKVELELRVYTEDDIYVKMYNFLKAALENACKFTPFDGKVTLKMVVDGDYYNTMYSGGTDMIFTTWGGAAYSPYTILYECYCDASDGSGNQMEYGFDTSKIQVTITVDGEDYTAPLQKWALWADGSDPSCVITSPRGKQLLSFSSYDPDTKAEFYGKLEYAYLSFFVTTPIYYRSVASLFSQKGQFAVHDYVDIVEFGGLDYYTFNYDDSAWASYVSSGRLSY